MVGIVEDSDMPLAGVTYPPPATWAGPTVVTLT